MNSVLEFMSKDHDRLEAIFKEFQGIKDKDCNKAKDLFLEFKTGLQRHIGWEEEILFPMFEERTGMGNSGPTAVMRMEHQQIKDCLEKIHNEITKKITKTDSFESALLGVLTNHNYKEENILYPWIDNSSSEKEIESALEKIKKQM